MGASGQQSTDSANPGLLTSIRQCDRDESLIAYTRYLFIEQLHAGTCTANPAEDLRLLDDLTATASELAIARRVTGWAAMTMLTEALALTHRIPAVGECLRDGVISPRQFQRLVVFTDLIDGEAYANQVDNAIAAALRRKGVCSDRRLRDLADRVIHRHDPDAVRRRHEQARSERGLSSRPLPDGMAEIGVIASAEDTCVAMEAVEALIATVCAHDPRSKHARRSDAAISRLQGTRFRCECDLEDCDAVASQEDLSEQHARIVVHVICQDGTLRAPGTEHDGGSDERPGFLDGHGVISAAHVRDIAARPDALIRPLNPNPGHALPTHLPSDPYRFSTALDTYIRARDGYCVFPGCNHSAWASDIDHVTEYNHQNPADGGRTTPLNGNVKCRFHHLLKTFGGWLDDQYLGPDGLTHTKIVTPGGYSTHGHGHTNEALFPALQSIAFTDPPAAEVPSVLALGPRAGPQRRRTRLAAKHARRRYERQLNRRDRESGCPDLPTAPPF